MQGMEDDVSLILTRAILLATQFHDGQVDHGGEPYILHPLRVMLDPSLTTEEERIVAVLHDIVEDTTIEIEDIRKWFGNTIAKSVSVLTKPKNMKYMDYIKSIPYDLIALKVKLADLRDNRNPERKSTAGLNKSLAHRYEKATKYLEKMPTWKA